MMKEGTVPVPPYRPALGDDDVVPVRPIANGGSHSGGGETPMSVLPVIGISAKPAPAFL